MQTEIKTLSRRIGELKTASMFTARDIAEAAMSDALKILIEADKRMTRLENAIEKMGPKKP